MYTITDHSSDVYGITIHPQKPFVFTSCSRDTSMRTFCVEGLIQALRLNFLAKLDIGKTFGSLYAAPEETFSTKGQYKLCGNQAGALI